MPTPQLRRRLRASLLLVVLTAPLACREAPATLGDTPTEVRANADELLGSIAARFGPALRDAAYTELRPKFAKSALVPSRIFDDRSVWTGRGEDTRIVELRGTRTPRGYWIGVRAGAEAPERPADYRHVMRLRRLSRSTYQWRGRDELAIGSVGLDDLGRALESVFESAESNRADALRAGYRTGFPRTTAALGRLFSLDTSRTSPMGDGATLVTLSVGIHPERLESDFPDLAKYLEKYVSPASYGGIVYDASGARWWEANGKDNRFTLRFRVRDGSLAPLNTSPRRIPDALQVRLDATAKIAIFTVGVRKMIGDVTLTRADNEKGFTARFRREPDWILPPLVEHLIRSPLRRPFEGDGAIYSLGVSEGPVGPTLATRDFEVLVEESAILRWFNTLGTRAVGDFRKGAEAEFDRFNGEALSALHADVLALTQTAAAAR